ncbi:MAG: hypothetical protein WC382_08115 [Methanoregulaceae archaeon]|jgi:starvation-inducible outer membrane lipoprotein
MTASLKWGATVILLTVLAALLAGCTTTPGPTQVTPTPTITPPAVPPQGFPGVEILTPQDDSIV